MVLDMNRSQSKTYLVSAPAKVILFGEHGVVYGEPCIASTLNKRTFGFTRLYTEENHLTLECVDIGLSYSSLSPNNHLNYGPDQKKALNAFLALTRKLQIIKGHFIIRSEIPVGAGLGSSASFSVVLATLLLFHFNESDMICNNDMEIINESDERNSEKQNIAIMLDTKRKQVINDLAFLAEKVIHGEPSGVDNTLCTFGGAKMFQRDPVTKKVTLTDLEGFSLFRPQFLLINTKVPKDTMHQVQKYKARLQDMPHAMNHITQAIGAITYQCAHYFQERDNQLPKDIKEKFASCIDMNHELLVAAGMSCKALDQVHFYATTIAGLSSKITGAGGGGCALCYLPTQESSKASETHSNIASNSKHLSTGSSNQDLIDTLNNLGMECFETTLGVDGVSATALSLFDVDDGNQKPNLESLEVEITKRVANCVPKAQAGDTLKMHYTGKFHESDMEFETSLGGSPFEFILGHGNVIAGWDQGIPGMCIGEKRRLSIPFKLAYGASGTEGIPPKSDLVFDIQLLQINDTDILKSYAVTSLPDLSPSILSKLYLFAGHVQVNIWKYFHILVQPNSSIPATQPRNKVLFWFNGGPGCSSMDGMFLENGPFRFDITHSPPSLILNEKGWWKEIDLVFVDQPPGTGYSLGTPFDNFKQVVDNFETFLEMFLEIYPMYQSSDIYLGGESFAGVWIPQIAHRLLERKKSVTAILLGSPWIDPLHQYPSIVEFAEKVNVVSGTWLQKAKDQHNVCIEDLKKSPPINTYDRCENIMNIILDASKDEGQFCINMYDYTLRDHGPNEGCGMSWPDGVKEMEVYLARDDVKEALHATSFTDKYWRECNFNVYLSIIGDTGKPSISIFSKLLNELKIHIYAGDKDLMCNILGLERSLQSFVFEESTNGLEDHLKPWGNFGTKIFVGKNISYYRLENASHMSPFDAPEASREAFLDALRFQKEENLPSSEPSKPSNITKIETQQPKAENKTIPSSAPVLQDSKPKEKPSHLFAAIFLISFFFVALFGGLFIRRKLSIRLSKPQWNPVSVKTDEDIEMEEAYDYEGRHLTSHFHDD